MFSCVGIEDAAADEGQELSFDVTHSTWPVRGGGSLTLSYATRDGTARSADYAVETAGSITIPAVAAGETSASAAIKVLAEADNVLESAETFTVTLRSPTTIGVRLTAVGTIRNVGGSPPPDDGGGGGGGGGTPPPANRPPMVTLSCAPCEVEMEGEVMLTASASDP